MKTLKGILLSIYLILIAIVILQNVKSCTSNNNKPVISDSVELLFTTIDGETNELLPNCDLIISTSITHTTTPTNSNNGAFFVRNLSLDETISISASKEGYSSNQNKIKNIKVSDLMNSSDDKRAIPLFFESSPCTSGGDKVDARDKERSVKTFNMGMKKGTFRFDWNTGASDPDQILVYNCREDEISNNSPIFDTGYIASGGTKTEMISFNNGSTITVVGISGPSTGTIWNYYIHCPE